MWDASFYNGKFYIYFSPVPVLLFYLPFRLLAGGYPADNLAAVVFCAWAFLASVAFARRALGGELRVLWILLIVLGGLFVLITASVMLQVSWFKATKRFTGVGKRLFRMAPLQHHFELLGWEQVTIVIRFWIITGLCVATGLGVFYAEWVARL